MCRPSSPVRPPPPPWAVEETDACFIARDAHGQAPAYVYFEGKAGRRGGSPAHVRRCTVLAAMRRYEFCQVFCRGIRAKLRCSLIPFSRLGNIRLNSDSAEPPDKKRIERLSQRESGSSAACFGGALQQQPSGREFAVLEEILTELDQAGQVSQLLPPDHSE
jgi:hypothetical protein